MATQSTVEGRAPTTVTDLAVELRRACARRWRLPNAVSGHGRRQGVAGVAMECCGGDGVARRELVHGYGDGGAAGARRLLLALRRGGRPRKMKWGAREGAGECGGAKAVLWPGRATRDEAPVTRGRRGLHAARDA